MLPTTSPRYSNFSFLGTKRQLNSLPTQSQRSHVVKHKKTFLVPQGIKRRPCKRDEKEEKEEKEEEEKEDKKEEKECKAEGSDDNNKVDGVDFSPDIMKAAAMIKLSK